MKHFFMCLTSVWLWISFFNKKKKELSSLFSQKSKTKKALVISKLVLRKITISNVNVKKTRKLASSIIHLFYVSLKPLHMKFGYACNGFRRKLLLPKKTKRVVPRYHSYKILRSFPNVWMQMSKYFSSVICRLYKQ